jgi:hypothetical protein
MALVLNGPEQGKVKILFIRNKRGCQWNWLIFCVLLPYSKILDIAFSAHIPYPKYSFN